jgi:hypothetical protein
LRDSARAIRATAAYVSVARLVVTAHHGADFLLALEVSESGLGDGIVVKRFINAGEGVLRSGAAVAHVIREAFEIRRAREGTIVASVETRHQLLRGIERFADRTEWNSGEHERLSLLNAVFSLLAKLCVRA